MKIKKLLTMVLTGLLVFAFIGCSGKKGGDKEPNNSIEQANDITLGSPFSITIDPKGDKDWFKVNLTEQGYLKVQASQVPEEIGIEVAFALYQEWEGEKEKRIRGWRKLPDALFIPKEGTYYFVIKDNYDDKSSDKQIQIKVDFLKEFDLTEPNNSPQEAKLIEAGSSVKPAIFPTGDNDWLKVKVEKQGYLTLKTKDVPEGITPEVRYSIFDEWADPKVKTIRDWRKMPDACFVPKAGEYYILLHDDYSDKNSEKPFDLKIDFLDEMDQSEPNDDFKDAKTINRGDTLNLAIFPTGDNDYYKIKISEGDKIRFMAKGFSNITPEIKLFVLDEKDPNKLKDFSGWKKLPAEFDVESGQEYFVLVHDDYGDASSPKAFEIRVE
jgi:phage anti-repressor protein